SNFNSWRPTTTDGGCHTFGSPNTEVSGGIIFTPTIVYVSPSEVFDISASVSNFGGQISSNDLTIGYNILDGDNSDFLGATVSESSHGMTGVDSTTPYVQTFTAPATSGTYVLETYAVTGDTDYWDWVHGTIVVFVNDGTKINSDYTQDVIDTLALVAEPAAGGLQWPETNKSTSVYKSGMIKGMASIGDFMLDVYEERSRSSLFTGLNSEEISQPLELAIGAGDWLLGMAETNASGTYWYEPYNQDATPSGTKISTPYYGGVAGIVSYLLRLYRVTHNPLYLDAAKGGADWLLALADTTTGYAWPEVYGATDLSTRWSKGGPGIASVFLEMFRFTSDQTYLDAAKGMFTWLDSVKQVDAGSNYWYMIAENSASGVYLGRWHGVAGIASFLIDLYQVTGDAAHKALALSAMDYVVAKKTIDGTGAKFENKLGAGEFISGWSRGPAGIGSVLLRANELDNTKGYMTIVDEAYNYLV
ncbi:MAG: lanthionine synthetase LanC family protein, partial [Candidatus Heimdallarchaeota archaeon]